MTRARHPFLSPLPSLKHISLSISNSFSVGVGSYWLVVVWFVADPIPLSFGPLPAETFPVTLPPCLNTFCLYGGWNDSTVFRLDKTSVTVL